MRPAPAGRRNTSRPSGKECKPWSASNRNRKDAGVCEHWRAQWAYPTARCMRCCTPLNFSPTASGPSPSVPIRSSNRNCWTVGLYLNPPEKARVLCVDEKPGIQALDRPQPLLPLRAKKPQSWTNEYVRHGTQTMIAALEIATGKVVAHVRTRRSSVNFLRFMNEVLRAYPGRQLHVVVDNLNIHKNQAARRWLAWHPLVQFH